MKPLLVLCVLSVIQTSQIERYEAHIKVDGIDCKACGESVKKLLSIVKGLKVSSVNITQKVVSCSVDSKEILKPSLLKSLLLKDDFKLSVLTIKDFKGYINKITRTIFVKDGEKETKEEVDFWKLGPKEEAGYILILDKEQQKLVEQKIEENSKKEKPDLEVVFKILGKLGEKKIKVGEKEIDGKKVEEFEELVVVDDILLEHIAPKQDDKDEYKKEQK